ncbi:MAG: helix-turn-helix transcriptional regulator [Cyclobacteriaceae bacterium]
MILEDNFQSPPPIKELARSLGTNENKLTWGFKKVLHKTVKEMVLDIRLKQAKLLIADNKQSLKEISHKIGYKNPSYFSKKLKEKFGILPKYFLDKYR